VAADCKIRTQEWGGTIDDDADVDKALEEEEELELEGRHSEAISSLRANSLDTASINDVLNASG
jgi:hypothetical protein